jgi:hypothetical protein
VNCVAWCSGESGVAKLKPVTLDCSCLRADDVKVWQDLLQMSNDKNQTVSETDRVQYLAYITAREISAVLASCSSFSKGTHKRLLAKEVRGQAHQLWAPCVFGRHCLKALLNNSMLSIALPPRHNLANSTMVSLSAKRRAAFPGFLMMWPASFRTQGRRRVSHDALLHKCILHSCRCRGAWRQLLSSRRNLMGEGHVFIST